MDFQLIGALGFAIVTAVILAALPLLLKKYGFFNWLGNSKMGIWTANFFGSSEPSKFAMNMTRVFFFVLIGFFVVTQITTDATKFELHKPVIDQMEVCKNSFYAQQIGIGEWVIKCYDSNNQTNLNLTNLNLNFT